ncbi:MAG: LIC12162 family transferase [Candidatus Marinarcus sp.]|uniref:LIC12162 family transferase n=1 Tax=Candidatus Marinarcus sp. TaxID=3100987 RepID=UPI003AFF7651
MVELVDKKVFLSTTALEEFWDKNAKNGVFLGEWCKLYDRKQEYEKLKFDTLEYLWIKKDNIDEGIKYCEEIYPKVLNKLVFILNKQHNLDKDYLYWDILLKPWLTIYIQIIYDKYRHIKLAYEKYNSIYTYVLSEKSYQCIYIPVQFLSQVMNKDAYNLQLYSQIIRFLNIECTEIDFNIKTDEIYLKTKVSNKEIVLRTISRIFNKIFNKYTILIANPSFKQESIKKIFHLWLKSGFLFSFNNFKYDIDVKYDRNLQLRHKLFTIDDQDKSFENLVFNTFVYNFPILYLEGYSNFNEKVHNLNIPIPDMIYTSQLIHSNEIFKFYVADNYSKFIKCYGQHGGGYGVDVINIPEEIEKNYADIYFSYGWKEESKVRPLSMAPFSNDKITDNGEINLILNSMSRYFYKFTYQPESTKGGISLKNIQLFLNNLRNVYKVSVRLYLYDFQLNTKKILLNDNKLLSLDNETSYSQKLISSRLNIFSHFSTGHLESLSINKPTIIVIPADVYHFRDNAKPYIQKLKDANILFDNPIEASEFVDNVYGHIDTWWLSDKVQKVREEFCYLYSRTSENWADEWIKEFTSILENDARK